MKSVNLPPDAELQSLARVINAKLPPGAAVNFYRIRHADESTETGIIFSHGLRRAGMTTRNVLSEFDADDIVRDVKDWIERIHVPDRWSTDPRDSAWPS